MIQSVKGLWRLGRIVAHGFHGLALVLMCFGRWPLEKRQQTVRWWSRKMLNVAGVELHMTGLDALGQTERPAALWVANHVSWLDIICLHSVAPVRFVAKSEISQWPLLGRLVSAADTVYLQRQNNRDALRVVHSLADQLQQGHDVAIFPEGTTSDGHSVLPFHANLFQAAVSTGKPVQPVSMLYSDADHWVSPAPAYIDNVNLMQSIWQVASARQLKVYVDLLALHEITDQDRRMLATSLHQSIEKARSDRLNQMMKMRETDN